MGSDAELYLFDYHRYRYEVVPALVRLLRTGEPTVWLTEMIDERFDRRTAAWTGLLLPYLRTHPTDLIRWCTYLDEDLRAPGRPPGTPGAPEAPGAGPCRSTMCPERGHCPVHEGRDDLLRTALNSLFEAAVARACLGSSQVLGADGTALGYLPTLDGLGVAPNDPVRGLLTALELRGAAIGHRHGTGNGIRGWLTAAEAATLAGRLGTLSLPPYEVVYQTAGVSRWPASDARSDDAPEPSGLPGLSRVRAVASLAERSGRGILWGRDLAVRRGPAR